MKKTEDSPHFSTLQALNVCIIGCRHCPRLAQFRESAPSKNAFEGEPHWRKPIPGFGDENARLLITGLAPSAQGGNRTGRIFTGDASAKFLFKALYEEGFASQPNSDSLNDGLFLKGCYLTAAVKCVPPQNKPIAEEIANCSSYYADELHLLKNLRGVLALGSLAFDAFLAFAKKRGHETRALRFKHGATYRFEDFLTLYASYHPSPQNTQTGKLTEAMFRDVLKLINNNL